MPHIVFLTIAALLGYAAWVLAHKPPPAEEAAAAARRRRRDGEASWDDLQPVDQLGLELGYRLITLVDKNRQGDLLTRIKGVRRKFAQEVGFLPPPVHVRDNLELKPSGYRITLRGVVVGEGEAFPGMYLAINPGGITTPLIGTATTDPAFGLPAHWIDERQKEAAQMAGFTVVDSETVMATHLSHLMQVQAAKLLSRTETQQLVEHVSQTGPETDRRSGSQDGLDCRLPESPAAAAGRVGAHPRHPHHHRIHRRARHHHHRPGRAGPPRARGAVAGHRAADLRPVQGTQRHRHRPAAGAPAGAGPGQCQPARRWTPAWPTCSAERPPTVAIKQEEIGVPACLLVPDAIRNAIARLVRRAAPRLQVLAHSEIPETHSIRIGPILRGAAS